jgi:CheY-like chemotaxis protein
MRILVVEDDTFFAQRITELLSDNGIEAHVVRTPAEALAQDLTGFAGTVVDVMLPNDPTTSGISSEEARGGFLAGVALIRRLRQTVPRLPVVLLSADLAGGEAHRWAKENSIPFVFKHEERGRLLSALADLGLIGQLTRPRSFIVHGHDECLLRELKDYIQNSLHWPEPVVLREQPNSGRTIIEKFEEFAGIVDWVFVLLTPDDPSFSPKTDEDKRRARQNVVFELGFFYGLIGRREGRVITLRKGNVELPSDIHGVVWLDVSGGIRASGESIRRELRLT